MSQPRPHASLDLLQQQCKEQVGSTMRRSQSYHGLDPLGIPSAVYGAMHDIHASFIQAAPFGRKFKKQPSFAVLSQSMRGSSRTSDGTTAAPAAGSTPAVGAAAHPVLSMLAEQVGCPPTGQRLCLTCHAKMQIAFCHAQLVNVWISAGCRALPMVMHLQAQTVNHDLQS